MSIDGDHARLIKRVGERVQEVLSQATIVTESEEDIFYTAPDFLRHAADLIRTERVIDEAMLWGDEISQEVLDRRERLSALVFGE